MNKTTMATVKDVAEFLQTDWSEKRYNEGDYSRFDGALPEVETYVVYSSYIPGQAAIRSRVPIHALGVYMSTFNKVDFVPVIDMNRPPSFSIVGNVRGTPDIKPVTRETFRVHCVGCNFLVSPDHTRGTCFGDMANRNLFVESAAWLGDSALAQCARKRILRDGIKDGNKYASVVSGTTLAGIYFDLKPYQAVAELVAPGISVHAIADVVEAAFVITPFFSLIIQTKLFGDADLSVFDECTLQTLHQMHNRGSVTPSAFVIGYGYLSFVSTFSVKVKPFVTFNELIGIIGYHGGSAYYRRIGLYCMLLPFPFKQYTQISEAEIRMTPEAFEHLIFC